MRTTGTGLEARVLRPAEPGRFGPEELAGLPAPVRRYLAGAVAPGTALHTSARLWMRGRIKVGRWLPFRARQVLDPHRGFVWTARAAGLIAGVDRYLDGAGLLDWKLAGLVTVAHGEGPDVSRSAAGRVGAAFAVGETPVELALRLDPSGRIVSLRFDRWGDPAGNGRFGWHPFGGEITGYASFAGLTVPSAGRFGWFYGTDRWAEGEFFRYRITRLSPVG